MRSPSARFEQILGVRFFDGPVGAAVAHLQRVRGYVVVPAAPAFMKLRYDEEFRIALTAADMAIADSGLMVLLWRLLRSQKLARISGLAYLKHLMSLAGVRKPRATFWVLPSKAARDKASGWLRANGIEVPEQNFYVAPRYECAEMRNAECGMRNTEDGGQETDVRDQRSRIRDEGLLALLESARPEQIIIAIGGGPQEKLGRYLKMHCTFRPAIHCVGAALGFLTGDQIAIPDWADRLYLGWLLRLFAQPRIFIPRLASAWRLPWLIARYGAEMPPLTQKRKLKS